MCSASVPCLENFKIHVRISHKIDEISEFQCNQINCSWNFSNNYVLYRHLKRQHLMIDPPVQTKDCTILFDFHEPNEDDSYNFCDILRSVLKSHNNVLISGPQLDLIVKDADAILEIKNAPSTLGQLVCEHKHSKS